MHKWACEVFILVVCHVSINIFGPSWFKLENSVSVTYQQKWNFPVMFATCDFEARF
jgi:hypothetical protein